MTTSAIPLLLALLGFDNSAHDQATRFVNPPAWILGRWHNSMESMGGAIRKFTFLEGDIIYTYGSPAKSVLFSDRFKGCEVEELAGHEHYRLEVSPACGGETYEFIPVRGSCGRPIDEIALTYAIRRGGEVIGHLSTSCNHILTSDQD